MNELSPPFTGGRLSSSRLRRAQNARQETKKTTIKKELELPDWFTQRCVKSWDPSTSTHSIPLDPMKDFKEENAKRQDGQPPPWHKERTFFNAAPNFYCESPSPVAHVFLSLDQYCEIAAITAASFATVSGRGRNTFWGLKANLALYCAFDGANVWLNSIIDQVAKDQKADILRLDAQDIMEMGGAFVSPNAQDFLSLRTLGFDAFQSEPQEDPENDMEEEEEAEEDPALTPKLPLLPLAVKMTEPIRERIRAGVKALDAFENAPKSRRMPPKKEHRADDLDILSSTPIDSRRLTAFWDTVIENARAQSKASEQSDSSERKLIVCIEDFMGISNCPIGEELLNSLADNIERRRGECGEKIMIVGTTCSSEFAGDEDAQIELDAESEGSHYRTVLIANIPTLPPSPHKLWDSLWAKNQRQRNAVINLRNIQWMLKQIQPEVDDQGMALIPTLGRFTKKKDSTSRYEEHTLFDQVLKQEDAHRVALTAIGLRESGLWNTYLHGLSGDQPSIPALIKTAIVAMQTTDRKRIAVGSQNDSSACVTSEVAVRDPATADKEPIMESETERKSSIMARLEKIRATCNEHEKSLWGGVVNPDDINTTFADIHVAPETVDTIRTLTSLALSRPDAFKYGVLATDNISGLMLYGPPGTGKTLLAKAVAKEAGTTVLKISGSDIQQAWVGESEKVIRAMFSLARKLAPCVVFIDEADSMLRSRQNSSSSHHRHTINQLLLEWDGLEPTGVFLMVATNRPFDLDDAVLRRLPSRVLVDLPRKEDREAILGIHLRHEQIDPSVCLAKLAEQTPYYSGSDLKNVVVTAAMTCVKEENEAKKLAEKSGVTDFEFAEKRTLTGKHFEVALGKIAASISADMDSLKGVKKFDEQFGDRKGRRKKKNFGFLDQVKKEGDARVRE